VGSGVHYPIPIHRQPLYQELGYTDSLPVAECAAEEVISLPVHPSLSDEDLVAIGHAVREETSS
jgi:dTDP-4-amino-4,6-dideoxygalactose transaminase